MCNRRVRMRVSRMAAALARLEIVRRERVRAHSFHGMSKWKSLALRHRAQCMCTTVMKNRNGRASERERQALWPILRNSPIRNSLETNEAREKRTKTQGIVKQQELFIELLRDACASIFMHVLFARHSPWIHTASHTRMALVCVCVCVFLLFVAVVRFRNAQSHRQFSDSSVRATTIPSKWNT